MDSKTILFLIIAAVGGVFFANSSLDLGNLGKALNASIAPSSSDPARRSGDPNKHVNLKGQEWLATPDVAETEDGPRFMATVFAGYAPSSRSQGLGDVIRISFNEGCELPWPAPEAKVVAVQGSETKLLAGLYTYDEDDLGRHIESFIKLYRQNKGNERRAAKYIGPDSYKFKVIDVAVTDRSAPVHLVFQAPYGHRLYNLHLAEGVVLDGVTMLGGEASAVANLPAGVPVRAMTRDQLEACEATFTRAPRNGMPNLTPEFATFSDEAKAQWNTRWRQIEDYNIWFAAQFGVRSDAVLAGYDRGHATLIGPVPTSDAERVPFRPLKGAPVTVAGKQYVLAAGHGAAGPDSYREQVVARARDLAGGDLTALLPRETAALQ